MHICAEIGGKIINEMLCLEAGWDAFIPILFIKENKYIEKQTKRNCFFIDGFQIQSSKSNYQ